MKKTTIFKILICLTAIAAIALFAALNPHIFTSFEKNEQEILFIQKSDGTSASLKVEVAKTKGQRAKGLMHRQSMPKDHGMLFIFASEDVAMMWMKNTLIPLDMLFIGRDKKIKTIVKNTTPNSLKTISSNVSVIAVLEINAMMSDKLSIKEGDLVIHPDLENFGK